MDIGNPRIVQPIFGKWELRNKIGQGKYGTVYEAVDKDGNTAAVKIISLPNDEIRETARAAFGDDEEKLENFVGEIVQKFGVEVESMILVGNQTDNVVKLYNHEAVQTGSNWDIVIVMEYVDTLKNYYSKRVLRVKDVIEFGCDIAKGLMACEKEKIIHRDIKEDNLFIGRNRGNGKIGDFGVSTIIDTNMGSTVGIGTPYYMAPEVKTGEKYTYSADIYSLGIVLYKMMNKTLFPFVTQASSANLKDAYDMRKNGAALPLPRYARNGDLESLGRIILKCCEFNPANRYSSASELYYELNALKNRLSPEILRETLPYLYNSGNAIVEDDEDDFFDDNGTKSDGRGESTSGETRDIFGHKNETTEGGNKKTFTDRMMDTIGIIQSIINNDGRNSTIARGFGGLMMGLDKKKSEGKEEEIRKKKYRRIITGVTAAVVALMIIIVLFYPKTAVFYNDESDNHRLHVKYLLFPDRRFGERSANYVTVDGWHIYYSDPNEDHSLYRQSVWGGDAQLLCDADCDYNIVIGDYVYFTSYDEGEILCRTKKDGTGAKETIINVACRELTKNGDKGLMFVAVETNQLMSLDTTTAKKQ